MNKFNELKELLTNEQVVRKYLGNPTKSNACGDWYISPFRREKTASFCVSHKGIHDFGSSKHYDIISFVAELFKINNNQAITMLCNDFNLVIGNEYENKQILETIKRKRQEDQEIKNKIENWYNKEYQKICDEIIINKKLIEFYCSRPDTKNKFDVLGILYDERSNLELKWENLFNADFETKTNEYLKVC